MDGSDIVNGTVVAVKNDDEIGEYQSENIGKIYVLGEQRRGIILESLNQTLQLKLINKKTRPNFEYESNGNIISLPVSLENIWK